MKIAILGTRGIPNHYGGFEQFAQYLSVGLSKRGHDVVVYNSHAHPYQLSEYQGVRIVHQFDPEKKIGTAGQFIYDLNCIRDSRKRDFDIILQLGYTSSSIWSFLLPSKPLIVTNMDGLEWKRSKYSAVTRKFLEFAEKRAVDSSDHLIADSIGIQNYLRKKYRQASTYIPYGADVFNQPRETVLEKHDLKRYEYDMLIARLEPENNVETILRGVTLSNSPLPILVIGNHQTKYGDYLKQEFKQEARIRFIGGIYDICVLNNLRYFSNIYYHGHSVGGTNPSLLEAMASQALICAHYNEFNSSILGEEAYYFEDADSVGAVRDKIFKDEENLTKVRLNYKKIEDKYNWDIIIDSYESVLLQHLNKERSSE